MMTQTSKEEIIDKLLFTLYRSGKLEARLLVTGEIDKADIVAEKSDALNQQIKTLIGQVMDEWLGQSTVVIKDIKITSANLQRSITKIKKNVNTAKNIVKAIGLIDDTITIAKKILPSL